VEEAEEIRLRMEIAEVGRLKLDEFTEDRVVCGEQQPESDHFIKTEKSHTGIIEDTHWREASGWFSYELKNSARKARFLYLSYFNDDPSRIFDILINEEPVKSLSLTGGKGMNLQVLHIPIPDTLTGEETLTIKIAATPNSMTAKIAEVRLLSQSMLEEE
jgi:hypothetical protein